MASDVFANELHLSRPAAHPLDAMAKAPDHHFLLLENDKVRVLDTKVKAGELPHGQQSAPYCGAVPSVPTTLRTWEKP